MLSRTSELKLEVQINHKCCYVYCTTKKHPNGLSGLCLAGTFTEKPFILLSDKGKQPYKDHLCLFRALTMCLHGHSYLDAHTIQLFTQFITKSKDDPKKFRGVSIDDLPLVEGIVERNIIIYDFELRGRICWRISEAKYWKTCKNREITEIQQPYHSYE